MAEKLTLAEVVRLLAPEDSPKLENEEIRVAVLKDAVVVLRKDGDGVILEGILPDQIMHLDAELDETEATQNG